MKHSLLRFAQITLIFSLTAFNARSQGDLDKYALKLNFGDVNLTENLDSYVQDFNLAEQDLVNGKFYKVVQFYDLPDPGEKEALEESGIEFLSYIPYKAFVVSIPAILNLAVLKDYGVRNISDMIPEFKQSLSLLDKNYPAWALHDNGQIDLMVSFHPNLDYRSAVEAIASYSQDVIQDNPEAMFQIMRARIDQIESIVATPEVAYVEPKYPEGEPENTTGKTLHRSNVLNSEYETGRHYDGTGVKVMLQDDGIIGPHIDYQGRIGSQNLSWNEGDHGDHCAGTIFGYGNMDPRVNGMAPGAELHVWAAAQDDYPGFAAIPEAYDSLGIRITSTSYSDPPCNGGYSTFSAWLDLQTRTYESLMHVFSAGNAGTSDCGYGAGTGWGNITGGHKMGKNLVTVAALDYTGSLASFSSRGPATDGRIKPDIGAKGSNVYSTKNPNSYQYMSGTSMSCPGVAGSLAQLYQAYRDLNNDEDPKGGLMKGLILNTATDLGNVGPDFKFGWGHINNRRAVEVLEDERYFTDEVSQDESNTHEIEVPEGVKELKVMVYWTDKEGNPAASVSLVNNIDITIADPSDTDHYPWLLNHYPNADSLNKPAVKGVDMLNNMEQVQIDEPPAGTYTLHVEGTEIPFGPQEYYVIYDFIMDDIVVTYPIGGEAFQPGESITVRWDAFGSEGTFTLEYSLDNGDSWQVVNSSINGAYRHYSWAVPQTVTGGGMVRISRNGNSDTGEEGFTIIGIPQNIVIEKACNTWVLLSWNPVDGAVSYDVMMLGEKYMEVAGSTSADTLLVDGLDCISEYRYFSVRAVGPDNAVGRRAIAIEKVPGTWNCIIENDLTVLDIISPPAGDLFGCQDYSSLPVIVEIQNIGQNPMSNFNVIYQFDDGEVVSEVYTGTIDPGEIINYEFSSIASLSANTSYNFKAWIEVNGDDDLCNNQVEGVCSVIPAQYMDNQVLVDFDGYSNCSFAAECGEVVCNLDDQFLNLENGVNDDIDWRVLSGITPTPGTGPIGDHTTGTIVGKFLYLEASGGCNQQTAILTTPCIDLANLTNPGLSFWYSMYGEDMGSLHVDVISEGILYKDVMEPLAGDWGVGWFEAQVYLSQFAGKEINIRFRGVTGLGEMSDMAIDDIMINEMTGTDEVIAGSGIRVFPNPSAGSYNLVFNYVISNPVSLEVRDLTGRVVYHTLLENVRANQSYKVDISEFDKGVYFLVIEGDNKQVKEKLLKY